MADQTQGKGFKLPAPSSNQVLPASPAAPKKTSEFISVVPKLDVLAGIPQPRDYAIGGGVLLVLLIAFFFVKRAYANHLAGKRVSVGAANAAGWWLFVFLAGLATAAVLAVLSPMKFQAPVFMVPLLVISLVALILTFTTGRRA